MNKSIAGITLETGEVFGVAGVGQEVQVEEVPLRLLAPQIIEEIGTDEPGPSGYQDITHRRSP